MSPATRALETCELAGLAAGALAREDLLEWDYGEYEGLTTPQIKQLRPDWSLWRDGCPGGEKASDVGERADRVIAELARARGPAAVFSHGHMLRVLGARWITLAAADGSSPRPRHRRDLRSQRGARTADTRALERHARRARPAHLSPAHRSAQRRAGVVPVPQPRSF